ncbi:adenosylcobinamide-phosphate synthase CbiB [Rhizobium sp. PAMB 3182]
MGTHFLTLLLALVIDLIVGDPDRLWRRYPHPVVWFGKAISSLEKALNGERLSAETRRQNGFVALAILLLGACLVGILLHAFFVRLGGIGLVIEAVVASVFLAQKSLSDHVRAVADGLRTGGLEGGRRAVAMIVGRDPNSLDEPGICRAAIESLAENFSDGTVAPALWFAIGGLPGLFAYKMLNTADSMIGHKTERYRDFGFAAARADDLANWPAARLSVLLIALGALATKGRDAAVNTVRVALRDNNLHRSPNSGWPEAAMAGALDLQLAGPRRYHGEVVMEPMLNGAGRTHASAKDIDVALRMYFLACCALAVIVLIVFTFSL